MADVRVIEERESPGRWTYRVAVSRNGGAATEHTVRLAWVDHEHWCGGRCPPSKVIEELLKYLLEREGSRPIPESFDASTARRWHPTLDAELPDRL